MKSAKSLEIKRIFPTSRERLFEFWTREDLIKQWFCPSSEMSVPVAETDVRVGGSYKIVMQNQQGETYSPSGTYEEVIPNERLVFSWKWADSELVTRVTLEFQALGDAETELTLRHDCFPDSAIAGQS